MKLVNLIHRYDVSTLKVITVIASLLLVTACGAQETPTPTATLQPVVTMKSVPTATAVPTTTTTNTPELPTDTLTATATTTIPTGTPTGTPVPAAPPTDTPTATPVPLVQVSEAKVIYHDAELIDDVQRYGAGVQPWLDLLVRLDDTWYGPERHEDDINALPLPDGYGWEADGGFSSLPNGEAWWAGPSTEGNARLIGPDGSEIVALQLKIEFY